MAERQLFPAVSILDAVDLCYKLIMLFDLEFPDECHGVWSFFDHFVYGGEGQKTGTKSGSALGLSAFLRKYLAK